MRIIKPGKLGVGGPKEKKRSSSSGATKKIEVWDDFLVVQKGKKKREYERDSDGRLVAKEREEHGRKPEALEEDNLPPYKPNTDYDSLEQRLGYQYKDRSLLERALTHRSVLAARERLDYERLEFLGDAVLDLTVAHLLSVRHPNAREGDLSKMRAALVNTAALAEIAKRLEIGTYIRLGRGERSSGGAERPSILADVMEAIVGAMYWDSDYDTSLGVVETVFGEALDIVTPSDPKTELQEVLHATGSEPPTYLVEMVEGPEHAPTFVTVVLVDGVVEGRGRGTTKKAAQQEAASQALERIFPDTESVSLVDGATVFVAGAMLVRNGDAELEAA